MTSQPDNRDLLFLVQERDMFVKYFQKPTQIYKYIAQRRPTARIFINRTVSYLKHRMSRNNKSRIGAKVDTIAKQLLNKTRGACIVSNGFDNHESNQKNFQNNHRKIDGHRNVLGDNTQSDSDNSIKNGPSIDNNNHIINGECYNGYEPMGLRKQIIDEVSFNFICNKKLAQNTRCLGFVCPWCQLDARFLHSLLCHLNNCHMRFKFNCVNTHDGCRIDITLNEGYDGSYCGFKYPGHDLHHDFRFTPRYGPQARFTRTRTIFYRYKSKTFMINSNSIVNNNYIDRNIPTSYHYDDGEVDIDVCSGRLYYHSSTCLPVKPNEVDIDSEADNDPTWLFERTQLMIDEFSDVNIGEKEILKMWNLYMMQNQKFKADSLLSKACLDFVEKFGPKIIAKKLYRNFTLHLANIYDYGLISSADIIECVRNIKKFKQPVISPSKQAKIKIERNGTDIPTQPSPAKRALLNTQCN